MHAIPTIPLLDAALLAMPGAAEGAVADDAFAQLLGQFGEAPQPDLAALAAAPPAVGSEAVLLPIAAVIAAVRGLATAKPDAPEMPADLPEDAAPTDTPAIAVTPDALAPTVLPATVAPNTVAVIATPVAAEPAQISAAPTTAPSIPAAISAAPAETPGKRADMPLPTDPVVTPLPLAHGRPIIDRAPATAIAAHQSDEKPAPTPGPTLPPLVSSMVAPLPESVSFATPAPLAIELAPEQLLEPSLSATLDLAHEGEWLDRLATDIARSAGKDGTLRFRLHPESLGSLQVEMTQGAAGASIRLTAETETARAIIADAQPRLIAEARAQGVRIAETHIDLGQQGHGQQSSGEQRGQRAATDAWVRTSGADASSDEGEQPAPGRGARAAAERYA